MTQLSLIDTPKTWRLDERTRATGRAGIAQARAALADAATRRPPPRQRPGRRATPAATPDRRRAAA
jgi:hypothetical protein